MRIQVEFANCKTANEIDNNNLKMRLIDRNLRGNVDSNIPLFYFFQKLFPTVGQIYHFMIVF